MSTVADKTKESATKSYNALGLKMRPSASDGLWLCCLIPASVLVSYRRQPECSFCFEYKMITVTALALCLQSCNLFYYLHNYGGFQRRMLFAFMPSIMTAFLYHYLLYQNWGASLFLGILTTLCYQLIYINVVRSLPSSFSMGEASLFIQGLMLFVFTAALNFMQTSGRNSTGEFGKIKIIMLVALFVLIIFCVILYNIKIFRSPVMFYSLLFAYAAFVSTFPITEEMPIFTVFHFIYEDYQRMFLIAFYVGLIGLTVSVLSWQMSGSSKATTSVRKLFHLLVVFVFVPGLILQCTLMYLATGVAFAIITIFEIMRILNIPPLGDYLRNAFSSFCDEKDAGIIALTPFSLLVGCSIPLWINPCPCNFSDTAVGINLLPLLSGVLSIGIGDTAASVVGSQIGKHKWKGSNKSIEGTAAAIVSQGTFVVGLYYFNICHFTNIELILTVQGIFLNSIVEAMTDQIDNIVLPLVFYIVVCMN